MTGPLYEGSIVCGHIMRDEAIYEDTMEREGEMVKILEKTHDYSKGLEDEWRESQDA